MLPISRKIGFTLLFLLLLLIFITFYFFPDSKSESESDPDVNSNLNLNLNHDSWHDSWIEYLSRTFTPVAYWKKEVDTRKKQAETARTFYRKAARQYREIVLERRAAMDAAAAQAEKTGRNPRHARRSVIQQFRERVRPSKRHLLTQRNRLRQIERLLDQSQQALEMATQ